MQHTISCGIEVRHFQFQSKRDFLTQRWPSFRYGGTPEETLNVVLMSHSINERVQKFSESEACCPWGHGLQPKKKL